jgi:hypothetical protein
MRPRDGSKDYFDRMRAGDIPEDPWGHTNLEAREPWVLFRKYRYFEKPLEGPLRPMYALPSQWHPSMFTEASPGARYVRYFGYDGSDRTTLMRSFVATPKSQYGYTWLEDRDAVVWLLNIYPGEIQVIHLATGDVLAVKRGFFRVRPMTICPSKKDDTFAFEFVKKVLVPATK